MKVFMIVCAIFTMTVTGHAEARSGKSIRSSYKQSGIASFYANSFHGHRMADGTPFSVYGDSAASRTLPLGTLAKVTNRSNGKIVMVKIRDRGPYAHHRILDVSPSVAGRLGFRDKGLANVLVEVAMLPTTGRGSR